jgi:hypothetical protein
MHHTKSQTDAVQREVEVVLARALRLTSKEHYSELTLVEILDSYDSIVYEDDKRVGSPQLSFDNRSKVYLDLLKFKKT